MKKLLQRLIPSSLKRQRRIHLENKDLQTISKEMCDSKNLLLQSKVNLDQIFKDPKNLEQWDEVKSKIDGLEFPDMKGEINAGDRKAIYLLISALKPPSVLEIGTHIGASTVHIAEAMNHHMEKMQSNHCKFVSVDVRDVNDPISKPWLDYEAKYSPKEMINRIGCERFVEFLTSPSLDYLSGCHQKVDFIFLDGDHAARMVYQEIPSALKLLNEDGLILLHDYFPDNQPLWSNGEVDPGPFIATERLKAEGVNITVLPLGELPWPTKLGSHTTSLALLLKNTPSSR